MTKPPAPYSPVNCEFHDVLEATATRRRVASIQFLDEEGALQTRQSRITNILARDAIEYLELDTGECIRLDRLIAVDGDKLADYGSPE